MGDQSRTTLNFERGASIVKEQARILSKGPGVYRMIDAEGNLLYVGKAKNLKNRVSSYTKSSKLSHRSFRMISETFQMEVVRTHTEVEALLLESNLIKRLKPRYNVLMRDDKSFPHILITEDHEWPKIVKHRGSQNKNGKYFGPFASAGAVNRAIIALQRAFLIRNCSDAVFQNRTRPCLQYQIKRCSAPCVEYINSTKYRELVGQANAFLSGRSSEIQRQLALRMQEASDDLDFETAAIYRNRIRALTQVQSQQDINVENIADADIIALHNNNGSSCIQVFFFRGGSNYGNRAYFPAHLKSHDSVEILASFIGQFYDNKKPPPSILVSHQLSEHNLLQTALSIRAGRKVILANPKKGNKRKIIEHAVHNAREALSRRLAESASNRKILKRVAEVFGLKSIPSRIEVFDNSHIQGSSSVGAMIAAGPQGFIKNAYRKFNIRLEEPSNQSFDKKHSETIETENLLRTRGDDYGMMRQVLYRRFIRAIRSQKNDEEVVWPDLVLIDGGRGQLSVAEDVALELGLTGVAFVAISKGPNRSRDQDRFHQKGKLSFSLKEGDPLLYYMQRLRDEAHRFAIQTHRKRRTRSVIYSTLDEIPGVGAKRKKLLLYHFGSARSVSAAGLADLEAVGGISKSLAKNVYDHFHHDV